MMITFFRRILFRLARFRYDFEELFFNREFAVLIGDKARRLWFLFGMTLTTLLSLGFAIGGLDRLGERMDNPYTNWVDLPIRNRDVEIIDSVRNYFSDSTNRAAFNLHQVNSHVVLLDALFINQEYQKPMELKGRTIEPEERELLYKILDRKGGNWLSGWYPASPDSTQLFYPKNGLVVTKRMLESLGFSEPMNQLKLLMHLDSELPPVFVDVVAVVRELPGLCDYLCVPRFYNLIREGLDNQLFINQGNTSNQFQVLLSGHPGGFEAWAMDSLKAYSVKAENFTWRAGEQHTLYNITFDWENRPDPKAVFSQIESAWKSKGDCMNYLPANFNAGSDHLEYPHYLAFNFKELSRVRAFKDFMLQHFEVEINMAQVEAKENFALVSRLTYIMALILFGFSLTSIVFYINNLLESHIEKIKTNLGTFMAFGLSNRFLIRSYIVIVLAFLAISVLGGFIFAAALTGLARLIWPDSFIDVLDWWIVLSIGLLFLVSYVVVANTIRRVLSQTPGDLIYGR